jgi:hypothetical protein
VIVASTFVQYPASASSTELSDFIDQVVEAVLPVSRCAARRTASRPGANTTRVVDVFFVLLVAHMNLAQYPAPTSDPHWHDHITVDIAKGFPRLQFASASSIFKSN